MYRHDCFNWANLKEKINKLRDKILTKQFINKLLRIFLTHRKWSINISVDNNIEQWGFITEVVSKQPDHYENIHVPL